MKKKEKKVSRREQLIKKWQPVLTAEGYEEIKDFHKQGVMAELVENETKDYLLTELTQTGDVQKWQPVLIPVIRRAFPNLISMDIFGTQPMNGPAGLAFAIKSSYQNNTDAPVKASNSVILVVADASAFSEGDDITSSGTGNGKVRYKEGNTMLVEVESGAFAADENIDDADPYVGSETTISTVYPNEAHYHVLFKDYDKFASVALAEVASTNIREVGFSIEKTAINATDHKLKAKYTDEVAQDLQAVHGLNAEDELTKIASQEVVAEQNWTFIQELITQAKAGTTADGTANMYDWQWDTSSDGRWEMEKTANLYSHINKVGNKIARSTLRGRANFIVTTLDVASKLEGMQQFTPAGDLGMDVIDTGGNIFVGTLGRKYRVYVDIFGATGEDYIALGYKGSSPFDAGIFYCPYIPLTIKKGMGEEDGQPRLFFGTRYALAANPFGAELYYRYFKITWD